MQTQTRWWLLICTVAVFIWPFCYGDDCNNNGTDDAGDIASADSQDCNTNNIPDECEGVPIRLGLGEETLPIPATPLNVQAGDVDGDGDLDIVTLSRNEDVSTLTVLLAGGERRYATAADYEISPAGWSLTLADFDGDGDLDTAVAVDTLRAEDTSFLAVFLNSGDGTFLPFDRYDHPVHTRFVTSGDVDGDDLPDLIAANRRTATLSLRLALGDGTFGARQELEVGVDPGAVVTADFDGDGDLDIASTNRRSDDVTVILNDSTGHFSAPTPYPLNDRSPELLQVADLDLDGDFDLVATTRNSVVTLFNAGDGTFSKTALYSARVTSGLVLADFNDDAAIDIAFPSSPNSLIVRSNNGRGRFDVSTVTRGLPEAPVDLAAGDYDGDGDMDIASALQSPSSVQFFWNGEGHTLATTRLTFDPLPGCIGHDPSCVPHSGGVADLDGDGDVDVVGASTEPGAFSFLINNGDGTWELPPAYTFGGVDPLSTTVGDVDDDGDIDILSADAYDGRLFVHLNKGLSSFGTPKDNFEPPITTDGVENVIHVSAADLDDDGRLDVALAGHGGAVLLFGAGDGTFSVPTTLEGVVNARAVVPGDFDGDGRLDLAVAEGRSQIRWVENNGNREFATRDLLPLSGVPNFVAAGDLDGDGDTDLVTANTVTTSSSVLLNRGTGTFDPAVDYATGDGPFSVILLDFDVDGRIDIITANERGGSVSVLLGNGDGTFRKPHILAAGGGLRFVFGADFDDDGDPDLVTIDRGSLSLTVLWNDSPNDAAAELFVERICTAADFERLSAAAGGSAKLQRFLKFTVPVREPTAVPPVVFQNTRIFPLHENFLAEVFTDEFPALSQDVYRNLVLRRATRGYFAGSLTRLRTPEGLVYGFRVAAEWADPEEHLTALEVKSVHDALKTAFSLEPLVYFPSDPRALDAARDWPDPGFPVLLEGFEPPPSGFEAYTQGVAFGRVRILASDEFEEANESGGFSFQDILVLHEAPRDIEGVVAGVVTAQPQGEFSHLSVRTSRRGTPNAFASDAIERFAPFADELVRIEVTCSELRIRPATPDEAAAWASSVQPTLSTQPTLDPEFAALPTLDEIVALDMAAAPFPIEARFGGKASGLARLQSILTDDDGQWAQYREAGFAIPIHYYLEFLRSNTIASALDADRHLTYEVYLEELFADPEFQTNPKRRFEALERLREHMRDEGTVDDDLIASLAARIVEVFGTSTSRERFRSSSNVEDAIEFNGAGLYDSTSVCAADDLDDDAAGPSRCQAFKENERGIARGLKKVWASLWNFRAYEERAFFGIPRELAAMGVLVNRAFVDELANGVAFTGNPTDPLDDRYIITVQVGEESVVSPTPGVLAEKVILDVQDGQVVSIVRAVASSLVPLGTQVLSDSDLEELGALLWHIDQNFPVETGTYSRDEVLLDVEFKIEANGDLAVKQVRPFLLSDSGPPAPTFELVVPPGIVACGTFDVGRGAQREYELKSTVRLADGALPLPTDDESFAADIVEELTFGPERETATALGPGVFTVEAVAVNDCDRFHRLEYAQRFALTGGREILLELGPLDFRAGQSTTTLDEEMLNSGALLRGRLTDPESTADLLYSSCNVDALPLFEINADLADGTKLRLQERFREELFKDVGPASLVHAAVAIGDEEREVSDYFDLVYAASRHNRRVVYWVVLHPPAVVTGIEAPVHVVELRAPEPFDGTPAEAAYRDESLAVLAAVAVSVYDKKRLDDPLEPLFRRGDVNSDADVNIADAVAHLNYVFKAAAPPSCLKAADTNDDGKLNVTDAVWILLHLFSGKTSLPEPFSGCGVDPTPDGLACGTHVGCR